MFVSNTGTYLPRYLASCPSKQCSSMGVKITATSQLFVGDMREVRILSGIHLNAAERTALKRKVV